MEEHAICIIRLEGMYTSGFWNPVSKLTATITACVILISLAKEKEG